MIHPAARLLSWLIAIVALQFMGWPAILCLAAALLLAGEGVRRRWWKLLRRARWLLLTLWLILAYGTPGEAWQGLAWAPTDTGVYEATLHAAHLVVMLGGLAWLFARLPREGLMAGLWALCSPFRQSGTVADRIVVRLALVFDYLDKAPPKGSWRHLLDESNPVAGGMDVVRIELPAWQGADSATLLGTAALAALGAWLG